MSRHDKNRSFLSFMLVVAALALFNSSIATAQSAFVQLSHTTDVVCAVRDDNTAVCNSGINVQARTPDDLQPVADISASRTTACAVLIGGDLRCWGQEGFGVSSPPASGAPYKSVSIGDSHGCAINRDNTIECWGLDTNDRLLAPAGEFVQLSVGIQQACAVDMIGTVSCWGANDQGTTDVPTSLPAAQKVEASFSSSCALLLDGSINCWGRQVIIPTSGPYGDVHTYALGNYEFGYATVCGVTGDGEVDCKFSGYDDGQVFELTQEGVPTGPGVTDLSLFGSRSGCYIGSDGELGCFGASFFTEIPSLDDNTQVPRTEGLRTETYSTTAVELLWNSPSRAFDVAGHEIQRNGEVVVFTQNNSSYLFDDIVPGEVTTFAVRRVSIDGNSGAFSDVVEVLTGGGSVGADPGGNTSDYQPPVRPFEPNNLDAQVYGAATVELFWDRENTSGIDGYEIRRNGEYIGFSAGTSFLDDVPSSDRVYRYDVIPVNRNDVSTFHGFSSIDVPFGGSEPGVCL